MGRIDKCLCMRRGAQFGKYCRVRWLFVPMQYNWERADEMNHNPNNAALMNTQTQNAAEHIYRKTLNSCAQRVELRLIIANPLCWGSGPYNWLKNL